MTFLIYFILITCFASLSKVSGQNNTAEELLLQKIDEYQQLIKDLGYSAEQLYIHRTRELKDCSCSVHACSNDLYSTEHKICGLNERNMCDDDKDDNYYDNCIGEYRDPGGTVVKVTPDIAPDELSMEIKESICTFQKLEDDFFDKLDIYVHKSTYIGTLTGVFRKWPRHAYDRKEDGQPDYNYCDRYDPRIRPWFTGAISGAKDVVIILERSKDMASEWVTVVEGAKAILNTLYANDFVNIVLFSDKVEILYSGHAFNKVSSDVISDLADDLDDTYTEGSEPDYQKAFKNAFDLFEKSDAPCETVIVGDTCSTSKCNKIIYLISAGTSSESTDEILEYVQKRQDELLLAEKDTSGVIIHTMTTGDNIVHNSLPRQLACSNNGTWTHLNDENILYSLATSLSINSLTKNHSNSVWITPYEDATGLGYVSDIVQTVISPAGYVIGVLAQSVLLDALGNDAGMKSEDIIDTLVGLSAECKILPLDPCQLQVLRMREDAVCTTSVPDMKCYKFRDNYYQKFGALRTRDDSIARCEEEGGNLTSIRSDEHLNFIASISSADGTWLGAIYNSKSNKNEFNWIDEAVDSIGNSYIGWAPNEPFNIDSYRQCVLIDRRGAYGNMYITDCSTTRDFICEFQDLPDSCAYEEIHEFSDTNTYEIPSLSQCPDVDYQSNHILPVEEANDLEFEDIVCDFGDEEMTGKDLTCCDYNGEECVPKSEPSLEPSSDSKESNSSSSESGSSETDIVPVTEPIAPENDNETDSSSIALKDDTPDASEPYIEDNEVLSIISPISTEEDDKFDVSNEKVTPQDTNSREVNELSNEEDECEELFCHSGAIALLVTTIIFGIVAVLFIFLFIFKSNDGDVQGSIVRAFNNICNK